VSWLRAYLAAFSRSSWVASATRSDRPPLPTEWPQKLSTKMRVLEMNVHQRGLKAISMPRSDTCCIGLL
jgi:hypothetical protein